MPAWKVLLSAVLISVAGSQVSHAQTAKDRAGELKLWRDKCSEPDTDLRTAYIEEAVLSRDTMAIRICTRLALSSNDADIRNLGLRASIASLGQITFDVEYPIFLKNAYKKAGNNAAKLGKVNSYNIARDFPSIKNGLVFKISEAETTTSSSTWFAMTNLTETREDSKGQAVILGGRLNWNGKIWFRNNKQIHCSLNTKLFPGSILKGSLQCGNRSSYKISIKLL